MDDNLTNNYNNNIKIHELIQKKKDNTITIEKIMLLNDSSNNSLNTVNKLLSENMLIDMQIDYYSDKNEFFLINKITDNSKNIININNIF